MCVCVCVCEDIKLAVQVFSFKIMKQALNDKF